MARGTTQERTRGAVAPRELGHRHGPVQVEALAQVAAHGADALGGPADAGSPPGLAGSGQSSSPPDDAGASTSRRRLCGGRGAAACAC